ncbi:Protein phosphatase [Plasmodiophora brassicae]
MQTVSKHVGLLVIATLGALLAVSMVIMVLVTYVKLAPSSKTSPVPGLRLHLFGANIPHDDKRGTGGEDAFFLDHTLNTFGVADGVGGWAAVGINSGMFSRAILGAALGTISSNPHLTHKAAIKVAHRAVMRQGYPGSTTLILGTLSGSKLHLTNLGDSGAMILRHSGQQWKMLSRTTEQQHEFNYPYQLRHDDQESSDVDKAESTTQQIRVGDIVIAASDGLWDNLFEGEIIDIVASTSVDQLAGTIAAKAYNASKAKRKSPFYLHCIQHRKGCSEGGKQDDITVIVGSAIIATDDIASSLDQHNFDMPGSTV